MSRCYPYQPTVSVKNGASGEALIGTIKLHREKEKSETESLIEKKRDRKDKRKERKEKKKPYDLCDGKVKKLREEKPYQEEKNRGLLVGCLSKGSEEEAERLEKSDLTDEHDEPVCYLSDGNQSGNKRKRQTPIISSAAPSSTSITVHKNIIRIRLSSQKHSETGASLKRGQPSSTLGRAANSLTQPKEILEVPVQKQCRITNNNVDVEASPIPESVRNESVVDFGSKFAGNGNTIYENKVQSTESFYESMIEHWVPPPFESEQNEVDDQEWLFGAKKQPRVYKDLKASKDVFCRHNSSLWSRAQHLPEADIYALPYTIPF